MVIKPISFTKFIKFILYNIMGKNSKKKEILKKVVIRKNIIEELRMRNIVVVHIKLYKSK